MLKNKKVLVTGSAGFIGFHIVSRLIKENFNVIGLDSLNNYYDVNLKYARLKENGILKTEISSKKLVKSRMFNNYSFTQVKLENYNDLKELFESQKFDFVINLAAQAGVRYSIENPKAYIDSNILGFYNIIQLSNIFKIKHLFYASSSSVYGLSKDVPFKEESTNTNVPASLYAASKKTNELIAHTYSHLFNLPTTGLRFFTVYGPWGRPDMALFLFTKAALNNERIKVFNNGEMMRDFTYIDDIVESVVRLVNLANKNKSITNFNVFNLGNNSPVNLLDFINEIEKQIGKETKKDFLPLQDGDVKKTYADVNKLYNLIDFAPKTSISYGVKKFIEWYKNFYYFE